MPYDYLNTEDTDYMQQPRKMGALESYAKAAGQGAFGQMSPTGQGTMKPSAVSSAQALGGMAGGILGNYLGRRRGVGGNIPSTQPNGDAINKALNMGQSPQDPMEAPAVGGYQAPGPAPMQGGSIITRPTTALLGENGPEAVVPLSNRKDAVVRPSVAFANEPVRGKRRYY